MPAKCKGMHPLPEAERHDLTAKEAGAEAPGPMDSHTLCDVLSSELLTESAKLSSLGTIPPWVSCDPAPDKLPSSSGDCYCRTQEKNTSCLLQEVFTYEPNLIYSICLPG
jgi:hypothetical protein